MGNKRKGIGKKLRFEVLKRDKFSCQYCGKTAESDGVILNIDHIKPVKEGGDNNILNLTTSCWDCNIGKGARELSDSTVLKKQRKEMEELEERRQQLKMMSEWRSELLDIDNEEINVFKDYFEKCWGITGRLDWGTTAEAKLRKDYKDFGDKVLFNAIEISTHYITKFDDLGDAIDFALKKIGGICYNTKNNVRGEFNDLREFIVDTFLDLKEWDWKYHPGSAWQIDKAFKPLKELNKYIPLEHIKKILCSPYTPDDVKYKEFWDIVGQIQDKTNPDSVYSDSKTHCFTMMNVYEHSSFDGWFRDSSLDDINYLINGLPVWDDKKKEYIDAK